MWSRDWGSNTIGIASAKMRRYFDWRSLLTPFRRRRRGHWRDLDRSARRAEGGGERRRFHAGAAHMVARLIGIPGDRSSAGR